MVRKSFHILIVTVLALNLMGAWALASALDCGMECCEPGPGAGTVSYESPSCCSASGVTCGFETGTYEEQFDKAICCHNTVQKISTAWSPVASPGFSAPSPPHPSALPGISTGPPQETPFYIANAAFLC